jgi:hypothetical protein
MGDQIARFYLKNLLSTGQKLKVWLRESKLLVGYDKAITITT